MRIIEVTCLLSDIQKTRKLAGKILSGQAIYTFDKIIGKSKKLVSIIDYSKKLQIADLLYLLPVIVERGRKFLHSQYTTIVIEKISPL